MESFSYATGFPEQRKGQVLIPTTQMRESANFRTFRPFRGVGRWVDFCMIRFRDPGGSPLRDGVAGEILQMISWIACGPHRIFAAVAFVRA